MLARELTRKPTASELRVAAGREQTVRWRNRTVAEIFPAAVGYEASGPAARGTAHRIGVAPPARCDQAFDKAIADVLAKHGCPTVMRATYLDASGTQITTVGIVRAQNGSAADDMEFAAEHAGQGQGLRALTFPGTAGAAFDDARRQRFSTLSNGSGYLLFRTSGWVDGRPRLSGKSMTEKFESGESLLVSLVKPLAGKVPPCSAKGVRC